MFVSARPRFNWRTIESRIIDQISLRGRRVSFRDFMEMALYLQPRDNEEGGYYSGGKVKFGPSGDFFTGPEMHSPFYGRGLARKIWQYWCELGRPADFTVIEMGCGSGVLSRDILDEIEENHSDLAGAVNYLMLDISPRLVKRQLQCLGERAIPCRHVIASAYDFPLTGLTGVLFSNELPDSFPFHRIVFQDGKIGEVFVGVEDDDIYEIILDAGNSGIAEYVRQQGFKVDDGVELCVCPMADRWMTEMAAALTRGFLVTIDYGYGDREVIRHKGSPARYYGPTDLLGAFDITGDVDFPGLIATGEQCGLRLVELTDEVAYTEGFAHYALGQQGANGRARYVMVQKKITG